MYKRIKLGTNNRTIIYYTVSVCSILLLAWISLFTGVKDIRVIDLLGDEDKLIVFLISRIPRTLALILVGAGLSIAGFIMQQLSQNRFVSPTTSGALEAAKMGILFALVFSPEASLMVRMLSALVFTFLSALLFIWFVEQVKDKNTVFIPLVGIMFGSILASISTFFAYKNNIVQNTQEWLLGDFSAVMQGQYEAIYIILPMVLISYLYAERFTIAGMGKSFATNLGLSYHTVVNIGLMAVSLVVSASVVTVGAIPFVGLIVPNVVSMLIGDNLRRALPLTAFLGAVLLLICDIIGRLLVFPYEIPIGMTVGIVGGITFFLLILKKSR
ncbi:ABC transporter permease [Sphingobacterium corticibacterium]|uniref:ABC transporter permease n=1 Tax=Sphingobacterium corticibacterium TaxID=2484746 RepID=A0A4Q6XN75_9SPHI|nr:iron chelate uptake ABC transporter family permease subunit [Sphingobacterium corticibacterium]RZF57999.1 ABC transporter permease [Sphingobacterium corticibacterium]